MKIKVKDILEACGVDDDMIEALRDAYCREEIKDDIDIYIEQYFETWTMEEFEKRRDEKMIYQAGVTMVDLDIISPLILVRVKEQEQ